MYISGQANKCLRLGWMARLMPVLGSGIYGDTLPDGRQSQSESQEIITVVLVRMSPAASLCLLVSLTSLLGHVACSPAVLQRHQRSLDSLSRSYLPPPVLDPSSEKELKPSSQNNRRNVNCSITVEREECRTVSTPSCQTTSLSRYKESWS